MIYINTKLADVAGSIRLHPVNEQNLASITRRVNRVKTLDGGVAVNDFGLSHADRTFTLIFYPSEAATATLQAIMANHQAITLSCREGLFSAVIREMQFNENEATLVALSTGQLGGY